MWSFPVYKSVRAWSWSLTPSESDVENALTYRHFPWVWFLSNFKLRTDKAVTLCLECEAVVLTSEPVWAGADLVGLSQVSTLLLMVYGPLYGWWEFTPSSGNAVLRLTPTKLRPEVILLLLDIRWRIHGYYHPPFISYNAPSPIKMQFILHKLYIVGV
jgi:hypothetical protein